MARRVSASMSRRVCASSSSRDSLASSRLSRSCCSPALRARTTISSACWRASLRRSRYSASSSSASCRVRCAASIDSSIACWRFWSASLMRGKANFQSSSREITQTASAHSIRPPPGWTRKLPPPEPPPLSVAARIVDRVVVIDGLQEERDEARDQAVEEARLGEREAEPLDARDLVAHLRLAGHRLDDLAEDLADADAGADGPEAAAHAERDRLAGVAAGAREVLGLSEGGDDSEVHGVSLVP